MHCCVYLLRGLLFSFVCCDGIETFEFVENNICVQLGLQDLAKWLKISLTTHVCSPIFIWISNNNKRNVKTKVAHQLDKTKFMYRSSSEK